MQLVHANDFAAVKYIYIDVIENTPLIEQYARWVYGRHHSDEQLLAYIERDEMYFLTDEDVVAGAVAISMNQGTEYEKIVWSENLPVYHGRSLGKEKHLIESRFSIINTIGEEGPRYAKRQ